MKLFLMRHSHALADKEDLQRPLGALGRETTKSVGAFFRTNAALAGVHAVWHSPMLRARETAELLVKELGADALLVETAGLMPGDDPVALADRLERLDQTVLLVGHEPQLSALATLLVRGKVKPAGFDFKKSAVMALEKGNGHHKKSGRSRWHVCWFFAAELLGSGPAAGTDA